MILTPYTLPALPRAAGTGAIKKALEKANVAEKWASSSWAKKLAVREQRKKQNDFERFEIGLLKRQKRDLVSRRWTRRRRVGLTWLRFTGPKGPRQGEEVGHRLNIDNSNIERPRCVCNMNGIDEQGKNMDVVLV
jgi:hypothetical protein